MAELVVAQKLDKLPATIEDMAFFRPMGAESAAVAQDAYLSISDAFDSQGTRATVIRGLNGIEIAALAADLLPGKGAGTPIGRMIGDIPALAPTDMELPTPGLDARLEELTNQILEEALGGNSQIALQAGAAPAEEGYSLDDLLQLSFPSQDNELLQAA